MKYMGKTIKMLTAFCLAMLMIFSIFTYAFAEDQPQQAIEKWTSRANMPTARCSCGAVEVNGKIYVIGGENNSASALNTVEMYDSVSDLWTPMASLPIAASRLCAVAVDNKIYVLGGYNGNGNSLSDVQIYDVSTNTWTTGASMPEPRETFAAAAVYGKIYVFGGRDICGSVYGSVDVYDPVSDSWMQGPAMTTAKEHMSAVAIDDNIYLIGGLDQAGSRLDTLEKFNVTTYTWSTLASMPAAKNDAAAAVLDGKIYVMGGRSTDSADPEMGQKPMVNTMEAYDPATNSWEEKLGMSNVRECLSAAVLNNKIYAIGGLDDGWALDSVEEYTPGAAQPKTKLVLAITMLNGTTKEYELSQSEIDAFMSWYENHDADPGTYGKSKEYYLIKTTYNTPSLVSKKEYITYKGVLCFEIDEYPAQ